MHNATPGFAAGTILLVLAVMSNKPGIGEALSDLYRHTFYIHPILLASALIVVCGSISTQGADVNLFLDKWLFRPCLGFFSHLFSAAFGASIPLAFIAHEQLGSDLCKVSLAMVFSIAGLFLFAVLSTAGQIVVESRQESAQNMEQANIIQLVLLFVLAIIAFGCFLVISGQPGSSEDLITSMQRTSAELFCGR